MSQPVVVKLGGDALASTERIVAQARRIAAWVRRGPVVAVASARRGVTDHLLGLVREVRTGAAGATAIDGHAEADRAVSVGEVVTASLLALALEDLGVPAVSLDAREAGLQSAGKFGHARIRRVNTARIERELSRGIVPVVTGFQGWRSGRVATLGRGGTESTAVSLAVALGGSRCVLVKDASGLRTADPRLVPNSRLIPEAPPSFLSALTEAGSPVVQAEAARLAEQHGVRLEFITLNDDRPQSVVREGVPELGLRAVAILPIGRDAAAISAIGAGPVPTPGVVEQTGAALLEAGVGPLELQSTNRGFRVVVPAREAPLAARIVHAVFVESFDAPALRVRQAS
jgi:aspartate kinase